MERAENGFQSLQLRIKYARIGLDDRNSAIEGLQGVEGICRADDGGQIESQILRVHVRLEAVGQALLLARSDLDSILDRGQVADDARSLAIGSP